MGGFLWALAAPTLAFGLLGAVAALRHATRLHPFTASLPGQVTLILPVTGAVPGIEALFVRLAAQTQRPRRLVVAVESAEDPALARVRAAAPLLGFPLEIAFGVPCDTRGQKCTNLLAALGHVDAADDAVVMLDADILPPPWWLGTLLQPLLADEADLVTGYRWPLLDSSGALVQALAWFDRGVATLPKFRSLAIAWGGSLAISRGALARLDLPRVLDRTLSDDLSIGAAARRLRLRVLTRNVLLLPTPREGEVAGFIRRQFVIVHLHRPWTYRAALLVYAADALGWVALILLAFQSGMAVAAILLLLALRLLRWRLHARIGERIGAPDSAADQAAQALVALAAPLTVWLALGLALAAWRRRELRWRHITYGLDGPERIRVLRRVSPGLS